LGGIQLITDDRKRSIKQIIKCYNDP
jgi:hypothetical protein